MIRDVDESFRPTLLVIHRSDDDARAILDEVATQVELGNATQHLRIVIDASTSEDSALWSAEVVRSDGVIEEHPLFDYLAKLGTTAMFRFVAVCAKPADPDVAGDLNHQMRNLRERMPMLLGADYPRTQARVSIVGYGDQQVDQRFFSALADANLAVIPLDRLQDASIATPVQRAQSESFRVHGAVELISATGLWRTMGEAPIDHVRGASGRGGDPRVRFVQSRIRLLRTPAVPVASLLSEDRELPLPDGFLHASNAGERMSRAAAQLLPPEFVHQSSEPPAAERQQIGAKDLALIIGREVMSAFVELPRLIWRIAGGHVSALTRRALQETVGTDSRYRVLTDEDELLGQSPEEQAHHYAMSIERAIASIVADESLADRLDPVPGELWTSLVSETLGLVDGDPSGTGFRESVFGDGLLLPVDRSHLLDGLHRLPEGVRQLAGVEVDNTEADDAATSVATATVIEQDPPRPPNKPSPSANLPLGTVVQRDAVRLELMRASWSSILSLANQHSDGDITYTNSWPYDLSGDVLTIRFPNGTSKHSARQAGIPRGTTVLLEAIHQTIGGAPAVIRVIVGGKEAGWKREFTVTALSELLGMEPERVLDELKKCGVVRRSTTDIVMADLILELSAKASNSVEAPVLIERIEELAEYAEGIYLIGGAPPTDVFARLHDQTPPPPSEATVELPPPSQATVEATPPVAAGPDFEFIDPEGAKEYAGDGLLVRIRSTLLKQVVAANEDIRRLLGILRQHQVMYAPLTIQRSVPLGAGIGIVLIIIYLGLSDSGMSLLQTLEVSVRTLDLWFTLSTLFILALALFLTDLGKSMGEQTRTMLFGGGAIAVIAYVFVDFDRLRFLISVPLRDSQSFAILLGIFTVGFVGYAAMHSFRSGNPLRIQGSRVLGALVLAYAVIGFVLLQSRPGSWWDGVRQDDLGRRLSWAVLVVALALVVIAIIVITVVRIKESRRSDNFHAVNDWALRALADAVEMRAVLQLADRQWLATLPTLAQVIRQPFGPIETTDIEIDTLEASTVLKSASVKLTLNDRGLADLESRVRQELISPSWLRVCYEELVQAYQEHLATRHAVTVSSLEARRPEGDITVPSIDALETGQGPGDRMEFANLVGSGAFDGVRARPVQKLDIARIFQPMLADQNVQVLEGFDGRGGTVQDYFGKVLPRTAATIPDGVVSTALAANEEARRMSTFVWWPERMLGEAILPNDVNVEHRETNLFRRGVIGGAGLVAVRVDVSGEFAYSELVGAVIASDHAIVEAAEDQGATYEGTSGL